MVGAPGQTTDGLRDLLAVVNSSQGLDEILAYLVRTAQAVLEADGATVYLRDSSDPMLLRVQATHGIPTGVLAETSRVGYPVVGIAVSSERPVVVCDFTATLQRQFAPSVDGQLEDRGHYLEVTRPGPFSAHDNPQQNRNQEIARMYRTLVAAPLVAHGEAYGALELFYREQRNLTHEHIDLTLAFAQQAALAIENAHLREQAQQRFREILRRQRVAEGLRDLLAVINSNQDLEEILRRVLSQSSQLLGNDAGVVYLRRTEDDSILHVGASMGLQPEQLAQEVRVGSPTTGLTVQQMRPLVCWDLQQALMDGDAFSAATTQLEDFGTYARVVRLGSRTDPDLEPGLREPRVRQLVTGFRGVLSTPLIARGRALGAITLFYSDPRAFSSEEVDLAGAFAQQASLAIENARLHSEAEQRMRENERRRKVAEGMRELLRVVNSTRSLDEILDEVLEQASRLLNSDAESVLLLTQRAGQSSVLTVRASRALQSDILPMRLPVGSAITGVAVAQRRPVGVRDLLAALPVRGEMEPIITERGGFLELRRIADPGPETARVDGFPRVRDVARHYRAILAVPLLVRGGEIQGAITLYYRDPRDYSAEDVALAESFADQTALAMENARLHAQTVQRTRDLEALYRADEALYRSLRVEDVLQALVDVAADVLHADMTSVLVWDEQHEHLIPGATRGFRPEVVAQMMHAPGEGVTTLVAMTGQPVTVEDAEHDARVAHRITDVEGIRSLLHVPIIVNGEVFGVFGVNYRERRILAGEEERLLLALARRAALAIENAKLFTESEQRRHELEALYRADQVLHRSLRLHDVLDALTEVATDMLHADKTSVLVWDADRGKLVTAAAHGYTSSSTLGELEAQDSFVQEAMRSEVFVLDPADDPRLPGVLREIVAREQIKSAIAAPIIESGEIFGLFNAAYCRRYSPSVEDRRLVVALAQRAGLAIQNAQLFERAQQAATAEERQRLARELHDAVTQTLFSASLIAEVLPRLWQRNPEDGRQRLDDLRRLTRGALAEMRTLLLELRPAALIETPFGQLLTQLTEATASRSNVHVAVQTEGEAFALPPETQIALYRVAQEALNNTSKHAAASTVDVQVRWKADAVEMRVRDNGRGFVPAGVAPGRLGLGIMEERARSVGAELRLRSRPGVGTTVSVLWRRPAA